MLRIFILLIFLASNLRAGVEKVGTTSAAFVKLGAGARSAALADAYVALADDASGIVYNPAGMSQMLHGEVQATHTEWFRGLRFENINSVFSLGDGGMVGLTLNFLAIPTLVRTEQIANTPDPSLNFRELGNFTPFDFQLGFAYSRPIMKNILGGVNLKVLAQNIDDRNTFGLGLDLGGIWQTPLRGLNVGMTFQNLGTPIKLKREAFDLPWQLRVGAAYKMYQDKLTFLIEADMPSDNALVVAGGVEYLISDKFAPRLGYRMNSIFNPWTAGLGMRFNQVGIDLSIVPFGELGMTYRGSVSYRFGEPGAELNTRLAYLSSNSSNKPAVLEPRLAAPDKVTAWAVYVYNTGRPAKVVRTLQGRGSAPKELMWDGKDTAGQALPEGGYWAILTARYATGKTVNSKYLRLDINNTAPQVDLGIDPVSINNQAPGEAFVPTAFNATLKAGRVATTWRLEILDPEGKVFRTIRGEGQPTAQLVWDGKGDLGEALVSGWVYQARFIATDPLGNEATTQTPVSFKAVFR